MCLECADVVALTRATIRYCNCGLVAGQYLEDGLTAEARGPYVAFGINTNDLAYHARLRKRGKFPRPFSNESSVEAWAMPEHPANIRTVEVFTSGN